MHFKIYCSQYSYTETVRIKMSDCNAAEAKEKVGGLKAGRNAARNWGKGLKAVRKKARSCREGLVAQLKMERISRPLVYLNIQVVERRGRKRR